MEQRQQNSVYVHMMADSLKKKEAVLGSLYQLTLEQETLLKAEEPDMERFGQTIEEKGEQILQLEQLDQGFDTLFRLVQKEIQEHREDYQDEIMQMQDRIRRVSELSAQIQAREHQNSERFKGYLARKKGEIREIRMHSRTASHYYQNMSGVHHADQSYFFNETK